MTNGIVPSCDIVLDIFALYMCTHPNMYPHQNPTPSAGLWNQVLLSFSFAFEQWMASVIAVQTAEKLQSHFSLEPPEFHSCSGFLVLQPYEYVWSARHGPSTILRLTFFAICCSNGFAGLQAASPKGKPQEQISDLPFLGSTRNRVGPRDIRLLKSGGARIPTTSAISFSLAVTRVLHVCRSFVPKFSCTAGKKIIFPTGVVPAAGICADSQKESITKNPSYHQVSDVSRQTEMEVS